MPFPKITSPANPRIKEAARLREHRDRKTSGLTLVEGYREICRAVEAGISFKEVYICPELLSKEARQTLTERIIPRKIPVYETTKAVFSKIAYGGREEGILSVCAIPQRSFRDLRLAKMPFWVVVEGIEKPGNLGAIIRTCDGAGVDGMIVCDPQTDLYNPNVIRTSLGTIFSVPAVVSSSAEAFNFLKSKGVMVCAASPQAKDVYTRVNLKGPLAVVVGSEEEGLSDFWMKNSNLQVKIPMRGCADSLNVSSSTAILLYEALRQRTLGC